METSAQRKGSGSDQSNELREALRRIGVLADLPDETLSWVAAQGQVNRYQAGEIVNRQGSPANEMLLVLEGAIEARSEEEGLLGMRYLAKAGEVSEVSGKLPYSRLTVYPSTSRALEPTWLFRLPDSTFPELLRRAPDLGPRLVAVMSDRIRDSAQNELQRERLLSLGRLAAGLAHELNNPAAASRRAARGLRAALTDLSETQTALGRHELNAATLETLTALGTRDHAALPYRSPVARAEQEDDLLDWLDPHTDDAANLAPTLADAGVTATDLAPLATALRAPAFEAALRALAARLTVDALASEIEDSSGRISELVGAIKEHTHLDRTAHTPTDVRRGLDSTLTMLAHRLRRGVQVQRDYAPDLPKVDANAGELNQVWTNLMDNAADAMGGQGTLLVRAVTEAGHLLVEIVDDGPGIPEDVRARIFDPFFTTKGVGVGSGLGLDISRRIVQGHRGEISVTSRPGETRFQVRLPLNNEVRHIG